ncbi:MAG: hypothetical protein IIC73_05770 [Armatimonadetes bacterium]|nr:hypothetical protein [Armatimonadota bacterium]
MRANGLMVTGFEPYLDNGENPSQRLAEECGQRFEVLEVAFGAVDEFVETVNRSGFDSWLAIGLADKAETMLVETVGHNRIGPMPDARGEVHGPGPIDPTGPSMLACTLWPPELLAETEFRKPSTDPGGYLCNYVLYRALRRFPEKRVGFLHVPKFDHVPFDTQLDELRAIIKELMETTA